MRTLRNPLAMISLSVLTFGCAAHRHAEKSPAATPSPTPATQPAVSPATTAIAERNKTCAMQSGGHDVLRVIVPDDTKCMPADGSLKLNSHERRVEFWLARGATSVANAVERVSQEIKDEFKDFKPATTSDLTVAGSPAKRLFGSGTEADDGDPGHADVVVFQAGGRVFIACTHGEHMSPDEQEFMVTVTQTAKAP